jgi:hypothetical protein
LPLFDASFCTHESNWKPNSGEFAGGNLVTSRQCLRYTERLLRIAVPNFVFGLAVAVMNSAQQVVEAREATKRTTSELADADATMRTLGAENQLLHKPAVIGCMGEKNFIWPVGSSPTLIVGAGG